MTTAIEQLIRKISDLLLKRLHTYGMSHWHMGVLLPERNAGSAQLYINPPTYLKHNVAEQFSSA